MSCLENKNFLLLLCLVVSEAVLNLCWKKEDAPLFPPPKLRDLGVRDLRFPDRISKLRRDSLGFDDSRAAELSKLAGLLESGDMARYCCLSTGLRSPDLMALGVIRLSVTANRSGFSEGVLHC